jgi:release factor glutamine methyltransferase
MMTVAQALSEARSAGLDKLDADLLLLLAHGVPAAELDKGRSWLLAHDTDAVAPSMYAHFQQLVARRRSGEPLAYVTGRKEFFGIDLAVDHRVLIPRPDTETLVEWALALWVAAPGEKTRPMGRLLDLGTGSGAIALAIKRASPALAVDAVDASANALVVARANAQRLGLDVVFLHGSWFEPVHGLYDCIVSNPPYVADGDPHLPALAHEPLAALTSGPDGLRDIRCILAGAPRHLAPGGWLLLEHGFDQGPAVQALLTGAGFRDVSVRQDLAGHWRCTGGRW